MGFNVVYKSWYEPFNININLDEHAIDIFKQIKARGCLFNETEADLIINNINKTESNYIVRR